MDKIDLESNVELNLVGVVPSDWNDADKVEEWNTALAVVHEIGLALLVCAQALLDVCNGCLIGEGTW